MKNSSHTPKVFTTLPTDKPITPILDKVELPSDLKSLSINDLCQLADELREFLLWSVGQSGGHFGANLGVVELTVALHTILNTPVDKLIFDVGHQAYAHKVLTGRKGQLTSIRSRGGLTAFPERSESEYDCFGVGHSSTAISAGLGMSLASRLTGENARVACVVGDGAMTGGMAFEAMNDAVQHNADLLVVLNDNDMSISQATGGFSKHLATLWQRGLAVDIDKHGNAIMTKRTISADDRRIRHYLTMASDVASDLSHRIPAKFAQKLSQGLPTPSDVMLLPEKLVGKIADNVFADNLFRAIGFSYFGPFDGHDLPKLLQVFERTKHIKGAVLVHIHTTKGKGFLPAENDPIGYHAITKLQKDKLQKDNLQKPDNNQEVKPKPQKYSDVFGKFLCDKASVDSRLVAITPAMCEGSGMVDFAKAFPSRFFDVAIAEQHAVTLAGGMATNPKIKPVVAIYSTFLQRGYDQLIHDVALQNLDVTFGIDRAGLVGEDGATHAGVFDLAFLRCVPNVIIATPSDENECYQLLNTCYEYKGVSAVRYPRGVGVGAKMLPFDKENYEIGKGRIVWQSGQEKPFVVSQSNHNGFSDVLRQAQDERKTTQADSDKQLILFNFGTRLADGLQAVEKLNNISVTVCDMRWVKPLDTDLIDKMVKTATHIATLEEHQIMGGAGSAVNEYLASRGVTFPIKNLGIKDEFIAHGSHAEQLAECGLDEGGILGQLKVFLGG